MAIEAPISKFKKTNLKIYIAICIGLAIWCAYDGYFNNKWIEEHTDTNGNPESYLVFNRKAPPYFIGAAVLFGAYLFAIRNKKIIADCLQSGIRKLSPMKMNSSSTIKKKSPMMPYKK
jgi:hypothetical protein